MIHETLTLSGVPQNLLEAFPADPVPKKHDSGMRTIMIQGDGANANAVFVGGNAQVTITDYGWRIDKSAAGVPATGLEIGPFDAGSIKPSQVWVIGTAGEKLHLLCQEF